MAEFLKAITDKFLDFFNIGRAMSIFIPGALVSFALLMLFSLVFFPVKPFDNGQRASSAAPAQKPVPWTMAAGKDDNKKVQPQSIYSAAKAATTKVLQSKQTALDSGDSLGRQLASDFKRVTAHYWVVVLLSLVAGIILYEIGNVIIGSRSATEGMQLFRYTERPGVDEPALTPDATSPVGLIYFAPYLKEDFTGKENYYNFLIAEYYRFLEFSAVMPLAVLITSVIAVIYYKVACLATGACFRNGAAVLFVLAIGLTVYVFYQVVFDKIYVSYRKAALDLIKGVTDVKNKGLIK